MSSEVLFSCFIYLITFSLSCLFVAQGEKAEKNRKIIVTFALLLPCLLAGLRAETVGTDVRVYVVPMFEAALETSGIGEYYTSLIPYGYSFKSIYEYEYAFTFILYLVAKLTRSLQAVLFTIQALTVFPIYSALKAFKKYDSNISTWLGMMTYYLFFYNTTLNLMRQWIAIAMLLFSLKFLFSKQYKLYYAMVVVASLFHTSALFGIFVGVIYYYMYDCQRRKISLRFKESVIHFRTLRAILIVGVVAILIFTISVWKSVLQLFGFAKYASYLGEGLIFSINQVILRLPLFVMFLIRRRSLGNNPHYPLFIVLYFIDVVLAQLVNSSTYAYRIAMCFSGYNVFLYPITFSEKNKRLGTLVLVAFLLVYWWYMIVYNGNDSIPYVFFFQK